MNKSNLEIRNNHLLTYGYVMLILFLTLSGFGQMPIFKRYYVADIPGFGWLAEFFVTHYIHYLAAILFLAVAAYLIADYLLTTNRNIRVTPSGQLRIGLLTGIALTGGLLVVRNLSGTRFSSGLIIFLDISHLGLVILFLGVSLVCLLLKKRWTKRL